MNTKRLSRRQFLQLSAGMVAASVLAGCVGPTTTPATTQAPAAAQTTAATKPPAATAPPASKYTESPLLAALVTAGKLPTVDQRLPENPLVVTPHESVGKYGGQWRQSVPIGLKPHALASTLGYYSGHNLVVYSEDISKVVPNIAESTDVSPDAKVLTIKLRKGLKWSDGEPMDTKDVEFWWKAVATNVELSPDQTENKDVVLSIIDDVTFEIKYPDPRPLQLGNFAEMQGLGQFMPEHYLKQFHPDYQAADVLEKQYKDAGFDNWSKYFLDRHDDTINPDMPTMGPWKLVTQGSAATQLVFERNPYYWAVDASGNQLPYIDSCILNIVESTDITLMKAVSGEIDMQLSCICESFSNYPLLTENATTGDYKVFTYEHPEPNALMIYFNIASKDPAKRAIFEKVEFRRAMSLAINRPEIVATIYTIGPVSSKIQQTAPYPGSPFADEEMNTQYTQYDPDTANKMLDELGLDKRDANGMRLLSDGSNFEFVMDVPTYDPQWTDAGTAVGKNWQDIGLNVNARGIDPSLWGQRMSANDFDCSAHGTPGGLAVLSKTEINYWTGYLSLGWPTYYQTGNITWRQSKGTEGVEPSAAIKKLWELGTAIVIEPDEAKRVANLKEVLQVHKDNLYLLGLGTRLPGLYIVKNYFKNVPALMGDWPFGFGGHGRPEQYYMDKPA